MGTPTFIGYSGAVNRNGSNNEFNINNDDPVTLIISPNTSAPDGGDLTLTAGDTNTLFTIVASDGTEIVANLDGALLEYGDTGIMEDGLSHQYVIITVGGIDYMFLLDVSDPTDPSITNPFSNGNSNPLDPDPSGGDPGDSVTVCFLNGTLILTPDGEKRVEDLVVGDQVISLSGTAQKLIWVGAREMRGSHARKHAPIRITANAFGAGLPLRDLLVSPQHRVLITDWRAELLFGVSEVLVPAKHLVNDSTIRVETGLQEFSYHHILFEQHETVFSEGLPTESFHPGEMAMAALETETRAELLSLFPELVDHMGIDRPQSHMSLKGFESRGLAAV
ncbi:hypothetical protein A9Q96_12670 [Rhodobacterales bacterium 52_120_T64]|nr:hypothetical protein A9Q96_12670 [Rhodobacterales bacterium 52_120_T64]